MDDLDDIIDKIFNFPVMDESFHMAADTGNILWLEYLIDHGVKDLVLGLIRAINNNHLEAVKFLLQYEIDLSFNREECLRLAARRGYSPIIEYLLLKGADLHINDDFPFFLAVRHGHLEAAKLLMSYGAIIDIRDNEALIMAAQYGYLDIVSLLLDNGADIHSQGVSADAGRDEAIIMACEGGHLDMVKLLIERGGNMYTQNGEAICRATEYGHLDVVRFLFEQPGYPFLNCLIQCCRIAIENGYLNLCQYYINYDIDIESIEPSLFYSVINHHINTTRFLLELGADVHIDDDACLTQAVEDNDISMVRLLLEFTDTIQNIDEILTIAQSGGYTEIEELLKHFGPS